MTNTMSTTTKSRRRARSYPRINFRVNEGKFLAIRAYCRLWKTTPSAMGQDGIDVVLLSGGKLGRRDEK